MSDTFPTSWQCLVAHNCGMLERAELSNWALNRISIPNSDRVMMLLMDMWQIRKEPTDSRAIDVLLRKLVVEEFPAFDDKGQQAEAYAQTIWLERLYTYVNGDMPPTYLCGCVEPIESHFDFPGWLGNMYHACDWVEASYARSDAPAVAVEARAGLEAVKRD